MAELKKNIYMLAIKEKTLQLIDALKATCQSYGMGNDGTSIR